jgi:hypothetical protein
VKLKAAVLRLKEKATNQLASLEGGEEAGGLSEIDSQKGNGEHHKWRSGTRICMFLDLPGPSLFVPIRILPSSSKNRKKNLDFYCFLTCLLLFIFEE